MAIPKLLELTRHAVQDTGDTLTGDLTLSNGTINGLIDPLEDDQAATKNYVDNSGGVFWAEYNVTPADELNVAYMQGKTIQVLYQNKVFTLTEVDTVQNRYSFTYIYTNNARKGVMQGMTCEPSGWVLWKENKLAHVGSSGNSSNDYNTEFSISAFMNGASNLSVGQARNIYCSIFEPTISDGNSGDLWVVYSNE